MTALTKHDDTASQAGSNHLGLFTGIFVILVIAMLVMLSSSGIESRRNTRMLEDIREQQFVAQQIINDIAAVSENRIQGFGSLRMHNEQFEQLLINIRDDLGKKGLAARPELIQAIQDVEQVWQDYRIGVVSVLVDEPSMNTLIAMLDSIKDTMPGILLSSEEIVRLLIEYNADPRAVYIAARQMALIQRIANGMYEVSRAGTFLDDERLGAYSAIGRDSAIYEQTLHQMLVMELDKQGDSRVHDKILEVATDYQNVSQSIERILGLAPGLASLNSAIRGLEQKSPQFMQACESLTKIHAEMGQRYNVSMMVWLMLLVGLLVLISLIIIQARSAARNKPTAMYEVDPQDLIDYISYEVKDIAKGKTGREGKYPGRLSSVYTEGMNNALEPLRERARFVDRAITKILSVSGELHQSVANIVDASDRLAQQANMAGSMVETIVVSMRRAGNEVASSMSMIDSMLADAKVHRGPVNDKIFGDEVRHLGGHIMDVKSAIINLNNSAPDISGVAKRIESAASKINLMALNTAVHAGEEEEAMGDLLAADEIQQYAQQIDVMTHHLNEISNTVNATITNVLTQIQSITHIVNVVHALEDEAGADRKRPDESNEKLIEKVRNVMAIIEHQFNSAGDILSRLGTIQETIVELSADVNEIMTRVEGLEKLSGELRKSHDR